MSGEPLNARNSRWRLARRLSEIDPRSAAAFRIGIASIILVELLIRLPDAAAFYADDGMFSIAASRIYHGIPWIWSLNFLHGSAAFQTVLLCLTGVFAAMMLVGYRTRLAVAACWLLMCSLHTRNHMVCNYGDMLLRVMLFWSMFVPLGRAWSMDARRQPVETAHEPIRSMAGFCLLMQLCIMYFFAGLWKLNDAWLGGDAIRTSLLLDYCGRTLGLRLLEYPSLVGWLTRGTLALEFVGPLAVWLPWQTDRIRKATIAAFVLLHVGIELCLTPGILSYVCLAGWLLFLPASFWRKYWPAGVFAQREEAGEAAPPAVASSLARSRWAVGNRRTHHLASVFCAVMLGYVVLWNIASLNWDRFGHVVPPGLRWIGHVAMLRQTWDMFYEPSHENNWFVARGTTRDGAAIDVLRGGRPVEPMVPRQCWAELPNFRWRFFFRRLGYEEHAIFRRAVIEYLLRDWNESHPDDEHLVELNLLHFQQLDGPDFGRGDFISTSFGRAHVATDPSHDEFVQTLQQLEASRSMLP